MNDYEKQAQNFLEKTGSKIEWKLLGLQKYWPNDKENRLVWEFTLKRGTRSYTSRYGDSLYSSTMQLIGKETIRVLADESAYNSAKYLKNNIFLIQDGFKSIKKTVTPPTHYDLLASLSVDQSRDVDEFASNYGYDLKTSKISDILETYEAVKRQSESLKMLFSDAELDELAEIS